MGQSNSNSSPIPSSVDSKTATTAAQWEWKSNIDPFSLEEAKWEPYKPLDNYLLEKAFSNKEKDVDLGDYIVSLQNMLQKKKNDLFKQRPVRRNTEYFNQEKKTKEEENTRGKRFFGAETPKTFNNVFGNLSDYLRFFENRNPEIKKFVAMLNDIEASKNLDQLNNNILPFILSCLREESKKLPKILDQKQLSKHEKYQMQLLLLFQEQLTSVKQFYAHILKAYTMEGFLYPNLNRYLRNEDWIQLDSLLPYAYCLCKAFFHLELLSKNKNLSQGKMILYRGAQFDQNALSQYDPKSIKNFCWNGMTSTSTNRRVSESFMSVNIDATRVPVMFIIEVPLSGADMKSATWIDIKSFSAIPNEDEIVLAPGSVFELLKVVSINSKKGAEIYLRLMTDVEKLVHQGQIMHGAMQSEMIQDSAIKIVCLEGNELVEAIAHLKGNQIIEEVEFCLCKFNEKALGTLIETLRKIPKLKKLIFISSSSLDKTHYSTVFQHLAKTHLTQLEIYDKTLSSQNQLCLAQAMNQFTSLTSLSLEFSGCPYINNTSIHNFCSQGIKHLTKLTSLNLSFSAIFNITDEVLSTLCFQGIKYLIKLTSLTLNFSDCPQITDKGLTSLHTQGIKCLVALQSLYLNFSGCKRITDEGLNNLCSQGIKPLKKLTSLNLHLIWCDKITTKGQQNIQAFLQSYQQIHSEDNQIARHVIFTRKLQASLPSNPEKESLDIQVNTNPYPTIKHVTDKLNKHSKTLRSLTLHFPQSSSIANQSLIDLCSQGIKHCTLLTSLTIDLTWCFAISDETLEALSQTIRNFTSLASLNLSFQGCIMITDKGLNALCSQGLKNLKELKSLSLDFSTVHGITDEGLNNLCSQGIKNLSSLTSLDLKLEDCRQITDIALKNFHKVLKYFGFSNSQ